MDEGITVKFLYKYLEESKMNIPVEKELKNNE